MEEREHDPALSVERSETTPLAEVDVAGVAQRSDAGQQTGPNPGGRQGRAAEKKKARRRRFTP